MIRAEDQRHVGPFGGLLLLGQLGAGRGVEHVHRCVSAASLFHRRHRCRVALRVGDPELEIVIFEELDVNDRRGVVVYPGGVLACGRVRRAAVGQYPGMEAGLQRHPGVKDRVCPLGNPGGVLDDRVQQAAGIELLLYFRREKVVQPLGVLPQQVHLCRVRAELRRPFNPGKIADQEPALGVFQPQGAAMVILERRRPVDQPRCLAGDLVHFRARGHVLGRVGACRVVRNLDGPRMRLGLWVNGLGAGHWLSLPEGQRHAGVSSGRPGAPMTIPTWCHRARAMNRPGTPLGARDAGRHLARRGPAPG